MKLLCRSPLVTLFLLLGVFQEEARAAAGTPKVDPRDETRFVMDGEPWLLTGYTPGLGAFTVRRDGSTLDEFYTTYHDFLKARGLNHYRAVFSFGQAFTRDKSDETLPYVRTGPGRARDGQPRFDLDQFDQRHFDYWRRVIRDAGRKGIVVQLVIFDSWHLNLLDHGIGWGRIYDVYHGANNVNGVTFDLQGESGWHAADPASPVRRRQQALIDNVVVELGSLANVIWEICNEPERGSLSSWTLPLAQYLKAKDGGRHLVVPLDVPGHQQTPGLEGEEARPEGAHQALVARPSDQPRIVHNDAPGSFLPAAGQREKAWAVLTGGAHVNYFFNLEDLRDIRPGKPAARGAAFVGRLPEAIEALGVDLRGMKPADDLVRGTVPGDVGAWGLARPGDELLVYKRDLPGNDAVTVLEPPGKYRARWYDPRRGRLMPEPAQAEKAGKGLRFIPPGNAAERRRDWVLHLKGDSP